MSTLILGLRRAYSMIKYSSYTGREYVRGFFEKILKRDIKSKDLQQITDVIEEFREIFGAIDEDYFDRFVDIIYDKLKTKQEIDESLLKAVYWGINNGCFDEYEILTMIITNASASPFLRYNAFKKMIKIAEFTDCLEYVEGLLLYVEKGSNEEKFLREYIKRFRNAKKNYREGRERLIPQINEMFAEIDVSSQEKTPNSTVITTVTGDTTDGTTY